MSVVSDRWRRVEALCRAALDRDEPDRGAFLASACGADDQLRREVEALLARDALAAHFLETPLGAVVATILRDDDAAPLAGRRIAGYAVVERVGAGGMREVYRARDTREWRIAKLWLLREMESGDGGRRR